MLETLEVIYRAANLEQAILLKNHLADVGIEAQVTNAALQGLSGKVPYGAIEPSVLVNPHDAPRARELAMQFEHALRDNDVRQLGTNQTDTRGRAKQSVRVLVYLAVWAVAYSFVIGGTRGTDLHEPLVVLTAFLFVVTTTVLMRPRWISEEPSEPAEADEIEGTEGSPWPACPSCHRPRHTSCPVCQTAGTNFPAAFEPGGPPLDENGRAQHALVTCPTCDEPFTPVYLCCEWCGYRFADGNELPRQPALSSPFDDLSARAWAVAGLIVLAIGALVGMFAWIASQV